VSSFQANSFDINFVVDLGEAWSAIQAAIQKSDALITNVDLFDIYEDEIRLPGKRSLSFTVTTQSLEKTLDDTFKNELIKTIVKNVEKKGGALR
jgi:phenylalanyl-tRNA synthetase beta subunit